MINSDSRPESGATTPRDMAEPGYNRKRAKLSFERMVDMAEQMGMRNPLFVCHDRAAKATTSINGKEYLNFSTYDYLDINAHPEITHAVAETAARFGTSAGASRLVGGERPMHEELERAFADLYEVDDAVIYVSGHAANVNTLGFMFGGRDAIFHDGLAHNSLVQGALLSGATRYSYAHNDPDALEEMLRKHRAAHKNAIIVTEGLFSMDGNIPDVPRLIELKQKYGCLLMVDEAHSLGVLGDTGRGVREHFGINPRDVDLWMSTLSKSMCGCGGFIAGRRDIIHFLKYGSPGFVFSVGMPPVIATACHKALEIMLREPERVHRLRTVSQYFLEYAHKLGLDTGAAQGYAVMPVMVGDSMVSGFLSQLLFERGIYVMPISFPAVKEGQARLRFFLSASHTEEQVRRALDAVVEELPKARAIVDNHYKNHQTENIPGREADANC